MAREPQLDARRRVVLRRRDEARGLVLLPAPSRRRDILRVLAPNQLEVRAELVHDLLRGALAERNHGGARRGGDGRAGGGRRRAGGLLLLHRHLLPLLRLLHRRHLLLLLLRGGGGVLLRLLGLGRGLLLLLGLLRGGDLRERHLLPPGRGLRGRHGRAGGRRPREGPGESLLLLLLLLLLLRHHLRLHLRRGQGLALRRHDLRQHPRLLVGVRHRGGRPEPQAARGGLARAPEETVKLRSPRGSEEKRARVQNWIWVPNRPPTLYGRLSGSRTEGTLTTPNKTFFAIPRNTPHLGRAGTSSAPSTTRTHASGFFLARRARSRPRAASAASASSRVLAVRRPARGRWRRVAPTASAMGGRPGRPPRWRWRSRRCASRRRPPSPRARPSRRTARRWTCSPSSRSTRTARSSTRASTCAR